MHWVKPELVAEIEYRRLHRRRLDPPGRLQGAARGQAGRRGRGRDARPRSRKRRTRRRAKPPRQDGVRQAVSSWASPSPARQAAVARRRRRDAGHQAGPGPLSTRRVGAWMLPHIKGRPLLDRSARPTASTASSFFQRHLGKGAVGPVHEVHGRGRPRSPILQIDRIEALAAPAQIGAAELHPWNCGPDRAGAARPAGLRPRSRARGSFDDGDRARRGRCGTGWRRWAWSAFCKTTGGKGLHVVTPLTRPKGDRLGRRPRPSPASVCAAHGRRRARPLPRSICPRRLRTGKIFLDYLRNDRLSDGGRRRCRPRARPGATVSMPLDLEPGKEGADP